MSQIVIILRLVYGCYIFGILTVRHVQLLAAIFTLASADFECVLGNDMRSLTSLFIVFHLANAPFLLSIQLLYYIMQEKNRVRATRTRPEHQEVMIDYFEKNPMLVTQKFNVPNARQMFNEKWKELAELLNSIGLGQKTMLQWQRVLSDWLSKIKTKIHNTKADQTGTGGGPATPGNHLTHLEERLMAIKGWSCVYGDNVTEEYGFEKKKQNIKETHGKRIVEEQMVEEQMVEEQMVEEIEKETEKRMVDRPLLYDHSYFEDVSVNDSNESEANEIKTKTKMSRPSKKTTKNIEHMHEETLEQIKEINSRLNLICSNIGNVAEEIRKQNNIMYELLSLKRRESVKFN